MSRIISAALLRQGSAWILGAGLAVSLVVGCGSKGDSADDAVTGGVGYQPSTNAKGGGGGVIYLTIQGGNRATGGRNNGFGGQFIGQGGLVGQGGQVVTTPNTCTTGTLNCPCYSSGYCGAGLSCVANKCVGNGTGTGGAAATGGSKSTSTAIAGAPATGGAPVTSVGGKAGSGGSPTGGAVATGGAIAVTGGSSGIAETGGAATAGSTSTSLPRCADEVVNTPNGVIACSGDCSISGTISATGTSLSYECDCAAGVYVCFAGSNNTVACPATVALEQATACDPARDDFCKLTATTTKTEGATTITTTTKYSCTCAASTNLWNCAK